MKYFSIFVGFVFVLFVTIFSVANTNDVTVVLPLISYTMILPLYLLILLVSVLSFLLGCLFMWFHAISKALRKRKKEKMEAKMADLKV